MKNILSFKNVVSKYDYFLFDQWGVLHNGHKKFLEAEKCLEYLKLENKKIILISNSASPTVQSEANLKRLGFSEKLFDYCITSCLLYTSPSPRDRTRSRMPSSA